VSGQSTPGRSRPSAGRNGTRDSGYTPSETQSTDTETGSFPALPGPARNTSRCCRSNVHRVDATALRSLPETSVCDLGQLCRVAHSGEAMFGKLHSGFLCLRRHVFVPVQDYLCPEGWVPTHFDGHVSPVWVQDMKGIMIHVRPRIFGYQLAEFTGARLLRLPH
jgi:hypothetical protein